MGDGPTQWFMQHSAPEFNFVEAQLEIRYNFKNSPWDAGIAIACLRPCYNIKNGFQQGISSTDAFPYFGLVGDYNFGQGKKVNPYLGLGLGMNALENRFMAAPRIGVEILTHLRIEATFYAGNREDSFFSLSIGAVLGGKPKKAR